MTLAAAQVSAMRRKVAWRILPLVIGMYLVAYLDRANVGFAKLRMASALGISEEAFGLGIGIFFIGYLTLEIPGPHHTRTGRAGLAQSGVGPFLRMPGSRLPMLAAGRGSIVNIGSLASVTALGCGHTQLPAGRPGRHKGLAVFVASDASSWITGTLIPMDGRNLAVNAGGTVRNKIGTGP